MCARASVGGVRFLPLAVALAWLLPGAAAAHDADVIYVLAVPGDAPDVIAEVVTLTPGTLARLAPVDADGDGVLSQADLDARARAVVAGVWDDMPLSAGGRRCEWLAGQAHQRESFIELTGRFRCGAGELRQDFRLLRVLPANYRVVLGSQLDGEAAGRGFAQGAMTVVPVPRPVPPGAWDPERFRAGWQGGLRRALAPEALLAWLAVLVALGAWRRGLFATGLALVGAAIGGLLDLGWEGPTALVAAALVAGARRGELPVVVPLVLACALGARGGGPWPMGLGQGLAVAAVLAGVAPIGLATGVMLARRPGAWLAVRRGLGAAWVVALILRPPWVSW